MIDFIVHLICTCTPLIFRIFCQNYHLCPKDYYAFDPCLREAILIIMLTLAPKYKTELEGPNFEIENVVQTKKAQVDFEP